MIRQRQPFLVVAFAALFTAVGLSLIVGAIGLVWGAFLLATEGSDAFRSAAATGLVAGSVICLSYFGAAVIGAPTYFLLQRWTDRWWGRALAAFLLGTLVYGAVGLTAVLAYVHLDINILEFESHDEAWADLLPASAALGLLTGIIAPFVLWSRAD